VSRPIGPTLQQGSYPGALLLDSATEHTRLFLAPLDRPGPRQRDEIMLGIEQRTTGSPRVVTLDATRAATIVQWFSRDPGERDLSRALTLDDSGPRSVSRDYLTLIRPADPLPEMRGVSVLIEHWTGEMTRNYREFVLLGGKDGGQIGEFYDWVRSFWFQGLPGVPRRRPDESAEEFAKRRRS
jgi:hypothetical protein